MSKFDIVRAYEPIIRKEIKQARDKFKPFNSQHEGYAVILEEVDELWDCIKQNKVPHEHEMETVQIIAMCYCYLNECVNK